MTADPSRPRAATGVDESTRWALAARDGDPVAAGAFIRCTQSEVWRFNASLVDAAAADDLTQETFLRAFRSLPAYEGRSSARTWLFGIPRRVCADHIRAVVRRRRLVARLSTAGRRGGDAGGDAPDDGAAAHDLAGSASAAELLGSLPPPQREAFVLTQVLGLSYDEAARSLGVPIGTIRSRVARARTRLTTVVAQSLAV